MADPLTLPGDVAGLLLECSPVIHLPSGLHGVVLSVDAVSGTAAVAVGGDLNHVFPRVPLSSLALALDRATGRAHAAWWLDNSDYDSVIAACDALGLSPGAHRNAMKSCASPVDGWDHGADADIVRSLVLNVAGREVPNG